MPEPSEAILQAIIASCRANATEVAEALNDCLGGRFRIEIGASSPLQLNDLPGGIDGRGICIAIEVGDGGLLILIPTSTALPEWCEQPDGEALARLAALAGEWAKLMLPPQLIGGEHEAGPAECLADTLRAAAPDAKAALVELIVYAEQADAAETTAQLDAEQADPSRQDSDSPAADVTADFAAGESTRESDTAESPASGDAENAEGADEAEASDAESAKETHTSVADPGTDATSETTDARPGADGDDAPSDESVTPPDEPAANVATSGVMADASGAAATFYLVFPLDNPSLPAAVDGRGVDDVDVADSTSQLPGPDESPQRAQRILELPVTVSARLAEKKIMLGQMLSIMPGRLITFNKSCEDLLDLYVNNKRYAVGEAIKFGEKFGIKINKIGVVEQRKSRIL